MHTLITPVLGRFVLGSARPQALWSCVNLFQIPRKMHTLSPTEGVSVVDSLQPGPQLTILGGIHGNELVGIKVVDRLRERLANGATFKKGRLGLAHCNLKAIAQGTRWHGMDLNRCFNPSDMDAPPITDGLYERSRARDLRPLIESTDILIDLHGTNKPSVPFVVINDASKITEGHWSIIEQLTGCETILWDPQKLISVGRTATSCGFATSLGKTAVCYETGWAGDLSCEERVYASVLALLSTHLDWEDPSQPTSATPPPAPTNRTTYSIYEMTEVFTLTEEGFEWNADYGQYNFQKVPAGDVIGHHGSTPYAASEESYIIFPKIKDLWRVGAPLGWLAVKRQ